MAKAGWIVGITFVILACVIYWFTSGYEKEGEKTPSFSSEQGSSVPVNNEPIEETPIEEPSSTDIVEVDIVEPIEEPQQVFMELDVSQIGEPVVRKTELMQVAEKNVVLLDGNAGGLDSKQMVYALKLSYGSGKTMSIFLNGVAYASLEVGDKLKVEYDLYSNDAGVTFPIIISADLVN